MDVSKLPKLSDTQKEQQAQTAAAPDESMPTAAAPRERARYDDRTDHGGSMMGGAEAWVSAIVGLICIMIGRSFPAYLISKMTGSTFHTNVNWTSGPLQGQEVAYPDLQGFTMLSDAAIFIFGVALIFEAALMLFTNANKPIARGMLWLAFVLAVCATLFNGYVAAKLFGINVLPIMSLLALAFGGYMAAYQWKLLTRQTRGVRS